MEKVKTISTVNRRIKTLKQAPVDNSNSSRCISVVQLQMTEMYAPMNELVSVAVKLLKNLVFAKRSQETRSHVPLSTIPVLTSQHEKSLDLKKDLTLRKPLVQTKFQ